MELLQEQLGPSAKVSDIRHPDDPGVPIWMVSPSGTIKRIYVAKNVKGGVLELRGGNVVLTAQAQKKGWRYLQDVHGKSASKQMDDHDAAAKKKGPKPERPGFFDDAMAASKNNDGEPPEGRARAAKALEIQKANEAAAERMTQVAKKPRGKKTETAGE